MVNIIFISFILLNLSNLISASHVYMMGPLVDSHDIRNNNCLFGKPYLSMFAARNRPFKEPKLQELSNQINALMESERDDNTVRERMRKVEQAVYEHFAAANIEPNGAVEFAERMFPGVDFTIFINNTADASFKISRFMTKLDGIDYFSITKLYYELMISSSTNLIWCPFDKNIGAGTITTGPFAAINNDFIKLILTYCLKRNPNSIKVMSLVCKQFHSVDLMSLLTTRLSSQDAARRLLLTFGAPFENYYSTSIFKWYLDRNWIFTSGSNEDLLVEILKERHLKYEEIVLHILNDQETIRLIPRMVASPSRLLALLDSMTSTLTYSYHKNKKLICELLNLVFTMPQLWAYLADENEWVRTKLAAVSLLNCHQVYNSFLKPSVRLLLQVREFDSTFVQFLPLFDYESNLEI